MGARKSDTATSAAKKAGASVYVRRPGTTSAPDKAEQKKLRIMPKKREKSDKKAFYGKVGQAPLHSREKQAPLQAPPGTAYGKRPSYTSPASKKTKPAKAKAVPDSGKSARPRSNFGLAPGYIILWTFILGICGYAYITHVFTTQRMLLELNDARQELERTQILYQDQVLEVERMSGPAEVLRRARAGGLGNYGPPEFTIEAALRPEDRN